MIKLDLGITFGLYLLAMTVFFTLLWWFSFRRKASIDEWNMTEHIRRCHYCGHVFTDPLCRRPLKCPLCESYLEESDAAQITE